MANLLDDLPNGRWDISYFAEHFLGIKVHPGQRRFFEAIALRNRTGWRAAYLTLCVSTGNRAGKTLAMAIAILWACVYKINLRPPDDESDASVRQWMRAPYDWYHFGIQQEVAELVFSELTRIFESRHEAQQGRDCPLTTEIGKEIVAYDKKERGEYVWIVLSELIGGAQIHFRSTTEKALGQLGKGMQGISMDECGFEPRLPFIIGEVFHLRRLSTGGQMLLISTPSEGFNDFKDEWDRGDPDNPLRQPGHMSLNFSTRDNVGYGIDQEVFDSLVASMPPELVPQNIDGKFVQGSKSFFNASAVDAVFVQSDDPDREPYLPERSLAKKKHRYIQGMDTAATSDDTYSIVLDATDVNKVTGAAIGRLQGKQPTLKVVGLAHDHHGAFAANGATCTTGVDVTGYGGKMIREALGGIPGLKGVEFGGTAKTKFKLLMDLKLTIEQGRLRLPRSGVWLELRRQLLAYRLGDRKLDTDAVMALAIAVKLVLRLPKGESTAALGFSYFMPDEQQPRTKEDEFWRNLRRRGTVQRMDGVVSGRR